MSATTRPPATVSGTASHPGVLDAPPLRGRRVAAVAFGLLAAVFTVGVVVQVFLAGLGVFGAHGATLDHARSLNAHRTWGDALGIAAVLLFLLGLLARAPRRLLAVTFILAVLTEVAQHGLAEAGLHHSWAGGLHAADGILILLLAIYLAVATRTRRGMISLPITDDDLTILRLIHAALRRDIARISTAVDDIPLDAVRAVGLQRQWAAFARQLHDHHVAEDQLVWPILRQRAGNVAEPVLAAMHAEHATIDPALADVELAFAAIMDGSGDADPAALSAALSRLRNLLEAHLSHEEADAIPLVQRHLTSGDLHHVSAAQRRQAGLRGAKAFLPWVLEGAAVADRNHVLGEFPPPLRWLVRRWQRRRDAAIAPLGT